MTHHVQAWVAAGLSVMAVSSSVAQRSVPSPTREPFALWRVEEEGRGRPAIESATAYFLSKRHTVFALDAATGSARWKQGTGEPGDATLGSAVTIAGSVIVAGDYNLVAFDRTTGAQRWRFVPALGYAPGIYLGESSGGLVFAGSPAGRLYAIASETGNAVWSATVGGDPDSTMFKPVTDGRVVAVGYKTFGVPSTGGVALLEVATGRQLWRTVFPRAADPLLGTGSAGGPIIADPVIVASAGDGTVYGFNRSSGAIEWTVPPIDRIPSILRGPLPLPETSTSPDYRPLVQRGQTLVVGSLKGDVVAYDLATRRERWRYLDEANGSVAFAIESDDLLVYVPFVSGRQIALSLSNGAVRWRTPNLTDGFSWPAAYSGGRVFMAGAKGGFVAFRR
jgi:outer membrane protein assembly factor BamB